MRGLLDRGLAQASDAASKARDVASKAARGQDAGADTALGKALRSITHTSSAAVPKEALAEALRLAIDNEENLAQVLRHVEDNVAASPKEWRRIHGGLQLLDQLLRPTRGEVLVGNIWFECKILSRLQDLKTFTFAEDRRVTSLVQRAAVNVEKSFKIQKAKCAEDDLSCSTRLGSCSERALGGSSVSSDPDVVDDRHPGHNAAQVIGHPVILETNMQSRAHSSQQKAVDTPLPQLSTNRNIEVVPTAQKEQYVSHDSDVCSDGGDSFMSRCCRCFFAREVREHVSPEEKVGLTVPDGSPFGDASV